MERFSDINLDNCQGQNLSRRRILFINQYYPPDTAATAYKCQELAETLALRYNVTVFAGRPSYNPLRTHRRYLLSCERLNGVSVVRVGSSSFPRSRMKGRISNYLSYALFALPLILIKKADAIITMTDPPMAGIMGALVAAMRGLPFIYSIQDLHPDMALASGMLRDGLVADFWNRMHRLALRRADLVVALGEDMKRCITAKGVGAERVHVVRHGASICVKTVEKNHPVVRQIRCGFSFTVLHAGNLGYYGAWDTLIKAAKLFEENVGFIFVGDGAAKSEVEGLAAHRKNVRLLPFRPVNEIPYVMAAGDIHVITIRRGLEGTVVPSKFYGILAAGRPILAVASETSDVAGIVSKEKCGLVADPDSADSIAQAIRTVLSNPKILTEMSRRAFEVARKYGRDGQLQKFVDLVDSKIK